MGAGEKDGITSDQNVRLKAFSVAFPGDSLRIVRVSLLKYNFSYVFHRFYLHLLLKRFEFMQFAPNFEARSGFPAACLQSGQIGNTKKRHGDFSSPWIIQVGSNVLGL